MSQFSYKPFHPSLSNILRDAIQSACKNGRYVTYISKEVYKHPSGSVGKLNRFLKDGRGMKLETAERLLETLGLYVTLHSMNEQQQTPTPNQNV